MTKEDLVGVYRGLGQETVRKDGTVTDAATRNAQIIYTPDGYLGVVSTLADRKPIGGADRGPDLNAVDADARAAAALDVVAYAGRYEVKDGSVFHHIEMSLNPNMVGRKIERRIHINGDDLTLTSVPDAEGSYSRIRWRRVR